MVRSKFAIITHITTFLAKYNDEWISSSHLARSININPVLVRKELALLKSRNLIESKEGKNGGVRLSKKASKITLSDIFELVKGDDYIFGYSKNKGNPDCPIGSQMNKNLSKLYEELDELVNDKLTKITLEEFKNQF